MKRRAEWYQISLIILGTIATIFFAIFLSREIFPEYKIYQDDYIALEQFRSTYTEEPPPEFRVGVKQILIEREDKGPPTIDRCTSCHVALQLSHFSPTKIATDINGNMIRDADGNFVKVPNEEYVWAKVDQKIADLTDVKVNAQLEAEGRYSEVSSRVQEAARLADLKTAKVGHHVYDVTRVLAMHPLIGKETRPFQFHSMDEYGCTSCHNGNGRGLTTEKAHGPVFDGQYEIEYMGPTPRFLEKDPKNDPEFSRIFNHKPGHELLFQTAPIFVGALIQAKCVQCHQSAENALQGIASTATILTAQRERGYKATTEALASQKKELLSLMEAKKMVESEGLAKALEHLKEKQHDYSLTPLEMDQVASQFNYLQKAANQETSPSQKQPYVLGILNKKIHEILGSEILAKELAQSLEKNSKDPIQIINQFLEKHRLDEATGTIFAKMDMIDLEQQIMRHVEDTESSFEKMTADEKVISSISSDVDLLTSNYHRGQQLFISQACYACHRITGLARGGVGPELSRAGDDYPWRLKESIVWPQADLKTSTMPNMRLDHEELQNLVTFLLGQKGPSSSVSPTAYKVAIQEWEGGRKMPWEKPIPPSKIHDLRYSMTVFATQGCAACHRLRGYESNVGYRIEKENPTIDDLYKETEWFNRLFPETIVGTQLTRTLDQYSDEIDQHIVDGVRKNSIIEEIEEKYPGSIESLYSNFRYAYRAKNDELTKQAQAEKDLVKKQEILDKLAQWKARVRRVMMVYIQEYGLGRLIGPRPNWAGIYRSDEWLMEHFRNPALHVPRSIMPIMPFDDSKFYALTYMLNVLGKRNRDYLRTLWDQRGFNPERAFDIHCSQCHGENLLGNGPVAEWIYPIPKNLRNAYFLRNLTKERAIQSIEHGVKGTPMPPWNETHSEKPNYDGIPILTEDEIRQLVDWIFSVLPGGAVIRGMEDVPKWNYSPKDVLEELRNEGNEPRFFPREKKEESSFNFFKGDDYFVALNPVVSTGRENAQVSQVFNIVPNPVPGPEKYAYYIKKDFYTEGNIEAGKNFFETNCAVCHGKEADGTGARAEVMIDAKPRMLTNLDWGNTRDDLRLLRSIKYGVPGTAMTPWGDLTSSLQRLQLVIFIRSLSEDREKREQLVSALYQGFNRSSAMIENARIVEYPALDKIQNELDAVQEQETRLYDKVREGQASPKDAAELYQKKLDLLLKLEEKQSKDMLLVNIKSLIAKEEEIYKNIGELLIGKEPQVDSWNTFIQMIQLNADRFTFSNNQLSINVDPEKEKKLQALKQKLRNEIDAKINDLKKEKVIIEGKIASTERSDDLNQVVNEIKNYTKLKQALVSGVEEVARLQVKERELFDQFQKK